MKPKDHGLKNLFGDDPEAGVPPIEAPRAKDPVAPAPKPTLQKKQPASPRQRLKPEATSPGTVTGYEPDLAVIIFLSSPPRLSQRMLKALAEQTLPNRMEVVAIGPSEEEAREAFSLLGSNIHHRFVLLDPGEPESMAIARAIRKARAPMVALLDWYTIPARDFVERSLRWRSNKDWDAIGIYQGNALPNSSASWALMLPESLPLHGVDNGIVKWLPVRNTVYRRSVLMELGEQLPRLIDNERLIEKLQAEKAVLMLDRDAQVTVIKSTQPKVMRRERFLQGRISAAREVRLQKISAIGRLFRSINCLIAPQARYYRLKGALFGGNDVTANPNTHGPTVRRGYISASRGRALGYLFGEGKARLKLRQIVRSRHDTLLPTDRKRLFGKDED